MSEFEDLEKKAEAYAQEHPEQADKGINEVAGFAERDTDHQHDEQIDRAVEAAEQHIGQGQDRQGISVKSIWQAYEAMLGRSVPDSTIYRLLQRHGWRNATWGAPRRGIIESS